MFNGFRKRQPFLLHDKRENVAPFTTPKAIKNLFVGTDGKRGGFFGVKGAKAEVVFSALFQKHLTGDNIHDIGGISNFGDFFFRDETGQKEHPPLLWNMGNRPAMEVIKWNEAQRKFLTLPELKYDAIVDARRHQ
jgi:hypothetical protein